MNPQFANAWMLYLLWLVPLMAAGWVWLDERHRQALNRLVAPHLRQRLAPPNSQGRQIWQLTLVTCGILLLLIAGARPQWGVREETVLNRGRDVVIAVDVSRSMLAPDVHPHRLGRAKADLIDLIRELDGDRAAVVAFRKSPRTVCPFTTDYAFLKQAIDGLAPHCAPRGETDIGAAITHALDLLGTDAFSHKAIVLVSDGEDLSGQAIKTAAEAASRGIPIYTVGIGSRSGSRIPDKESQTGYLQDGGNDAVSKLDDSTLHGIAEASAGGAYIPLGTAGTASTTLGQLYRKRLATIEARDMAETQRRRVIERYQWFLAPALLCLLAAAALSRGRLAIKRQRTPLSPLLVLILLPCWMHATSTNALQPQAEAPSSPRVGHDAAWEAQRLAKQGKHAEAAERFEQAAQGVSSKVARTFLHNAAAAHYRAGHLDRAETLLSQLAASPTLPNREETLEALGGVLYDLAENTTVTNAATAQSRSDMLKRSGDTMRDAARQAPEESLSEKLAAISERWKKATAETEQRRLAEAYGDMQLPQLMNQLFREQRQIREQAYAQVTNQTPSRVTALEELAQSQRELARAWGPLQEKLAQAISQQDAGTNAQQMAALSQYAEQTRTMADSTANLLRDLEPESFTAARQSEEATYQVWKPTAAFEDLFAEGIYRQTNAIFATQAAEAKKPIDYQQLTYDQREAAELTRLFRERFSAAIPEEGNLQVETNMVDNVPTVTTNGISAEARAEIIGLSELLESAQTQCSSALGKRDFTTAITQQDECMGAVQRISELLPKPPPQQQEQQQDQQQQDEQEQQPQQGEEQEDQSESPQEQQQPPPEEEKKPEESREQRDAKTLLERALEREREYEEMKRERDRQMPMLPGQRDL